MWNDDETAVLKNQYRERLTVLLTRAKDHGRIRDDATLTDIDLVFWAVRGVIESTRGVTDSGWQRVLAVLIAGLRPGAEALDTLPVSDKDYVTIAARLNPR
jgi:hypothetical protein